jgi:hypothetical protein
MFISACHHSLSWHRLIPSTPFHPFPQDSFSYYSPICATYPTHLILLDLIFQIIFGEEFQTCLFLTLTMLSQLLIFYNIEWQGLLRRMWKKQLCSVFLRHYLFIYIYVRSDTFGTQSLLRSLGSSVSIVSDYRLDDRAIDVWSLAEAKDFSSSLCPYQLRPTQSPIQRVPTVLSPGVKCGVGVTLTTHPYLVQMSWMSRSYTSSPTHTSIGVLWDCVKWVAHLVWLKYHFKNLVRLISQMLQACDCFMVVCVLV